ncbi:Queuine tRNA-ribosyltransferase [Armadillidium vulgare]|nr:Queuine tRNA-ribosyltransferase [Armadillidium vulgare]
MIFYLNKRIMNSSNLSSVSKALKFNVIAECPVSKARTSVMELPNYKVELPIFMPVGTQGTIKGLTPEQVEETGAQIILGNTYHLGSRPGVDILGNYESLHEFMKWKRAFAH